MMFRTIWSKTLRDYRIPIIAWGLGIAFLLFAVFAAYTQIQGTSSTATLNQLAQSARFLADPIDLGTPAGYATWRVMSFSVPILLAIWALLAGARLIRGEEERGALDLLLSTPRSRMRLLIEKVVALIVALLIIGLLIGLGAIAGEKAANGQIDAGRAILAGLNTSLFAFFFAACALFLSQILRSRGAAAGWTGILIALAFLLDSTGRVVDNGQWIRYFSPLYYYNLNKPLVSSSPSQIGAALALLGASLLLIVISMPLFLKRDIGGVALPSSHYRADKAQPAISMRALARAQRDVFGRAIILRAVRTQLWPAFWWMLGLAFYASWTTLLLPALLAPLHTILGNSSFFKNLLSGQDVATNAGFLSFIVFQFTTILAVVFAMTQAVKWPSDLDNGYMELVLSAPRSRPRILLERFGATLLFALLAPLILWLSVLLSADFANLSVDINKVAAASFGILPLELIIIAAVYVLAERIRAGVIVGLVSAYLAVAFLGELLRTLLNLPDWVMSLSIFHSYGNPVVDGWQWGSIAIMLGIAALLLVLGIVQFRQGDIERGS